MVDNFYLHFRDVNLQAQRSTLTNEDSSRNGQEFVGKVNIEETMDHIVDGVFCRSFIF